MEAEALTTYTAAMQDEPEAVEPAVTDLDASADLEDSADLEEDSADLDDSADLEDSADFDDSADFEDDTELDEASGAVQASAERTFRDFGIAEPICAALEAEGITTAFPIQALTLPIALDGHDLIGQARTGTGKTLAFGIPILERLDDMAGAGTPATPRALVVVPTRELAFQVAEDLQIAGSRKGAKVVVLYGGRAYEPQIEALATADIVVGTPGRLLDLVRQGHLKLSQVHVLVLDEADKMLDLGFLPDVEKILSLTPRDRQTMLFSATMPGEVVTLARRHLSRPMHIRAEQHDEPAHVPSTQQHVYRAHQMDKIEVLARVLQAQGRGLSIVFCRTKRSCDQVSSALTTRGFAAAAVHGDLGQGQRERAMRAFRAGKVDVLVATDVAARGLDVDDVTHVVNYECPEDEKAYLHRIGRTGRAGRAGVAVTFVDWHDMPRWKLINETLNLGHPEPVETYSTSEHLFGDLQIPAGVTGTLPRSQRERLGLEAEQLEDIGETGSHRSRGGPADHGRGRPGGPERRPERGSAAGDSPAREPGQRKQRVRRRTRSGIQLGDGAAGARGAGGTNGTREAGSGHGDQPRTDQARTGGPAPAGSQPPRRRRRRSSRGGGQGGQGAQGGSRSNGGGQGE
jgi:superfamily II DNA/RNA helicase